MKRSAVGGPRGLQDSLERLRQALLREADREEHWRELARLRERTGTLPGFLSRALHLPPLLRLLAQHGDDGPLLELALSLLGLAPSEDWSGTGFPPEVTRIQDEAPMVLLPGSAFTSRRLGSEVFRDAPSLRQTQACYMDRYEISVDRFARFLQATGSAPPRYWKLQQERPEVPVVFISWPEVLAYAGWAGGRPPREAEWERACQHSPAARFPWGDEQATPERANFHWEDGFRDPRRWQEYLSPLGSTRAGRSQTGVEDLLGNVQEWCLLDEAAFPPGETASSRDCVVRGVSWRHREAQLHAMARQEVDPRSRESTLGFRLVVALAP